MRLAEIATHLSTLTGRDADKIHIALRAPAMKPLFRSNPGPTPKSPGEYGPLELLRARLLLAGQTCKLTVSELKTVNACLNEGVAPKGGGRNSTRLALIGAGADWIIRIRYIEDAEGERHAAVAIGPEKELAIDDASAVRAHNAQGRNDHTVETGRLIIPASHLIAPLRPFLSQA